MTGKLTTRDAAGIPVAHGAALSEFAAEGFWSGTRIGRLDAMNKTIPRLGRTSAYQEASSSDQWATAFRASNNNTYFNEGDNRVSQIARNSNCGSGSLT